MVDINNFEKRHIGLSNDDRKTILEQLGETSLEAFIGKIVPDDIRLKGSLNLPQGISEQAALLELKGMAQKNKVMKSLIGQGYYDTNLPEVIKRNVFENPAWYTAYTPYQAEISQGRLEVLFNFQTLICELTGLPVAGASLLDEATAAGEAMRLAFRSGRGKRLVFLVSQSIFPQTYDVLQTQASPLGIELRSFNPQEGLPQTQEAFGLFLQYPTNTGDVVDISTLLKQAQAQGIMTIVASDILALTLMTPPGEMGADMVVGTSQRFGVPMGAGGPHAGFMAVKKGLERQMPGRIIGQSVDTKGRVAYRMALQTREQHIRREKATSNICTSQVLLAVLATLYAQYHGPSGLRCIAKDVHQKTGGLAKALEHLGYVRSNKYFFDTLTIEVQDLGSDVFKEANKAGYNLFQTSNEQLSISVDECTSWVDIETLVGLFAKACGKTAPTLDKTYEGLPKALLRKDSYLSQEAFHAYHSETAMMRFLRKCADKDLALDRAMIPLGSCTMKLNAASQMVPVTWPEFSKIHPFAPLEQQEGYEHLIADLNDWLCEITGYAAMSFQPNAGSQGEYAGLLAIRGYLNDQGQSQRHVCLIPASAHGTNPASAVLAGFKVVVIKTNKNGDIDIADLDAKLEKYHDEIAALMITYPSTHGVFEDNLRSICQKIHKAGGQVYIDGANMNALVGLVKLGEVGSDVSHLNLHKTFAIPHGGGGPGVGPIGVGAHLVPYLPGHRYRQTLGQAPVAGAPFGSASILPITWMYIRMLGKKGVVEATKNAILGANYLAYRLKDDYPILYKGHNGYVGHECIIDPRGFKQRANVTVDDLAKRLIDYGFHSPTMSWPVTGTLMLEPTESEPLEELNRLADAFIGMSKEVDDIEKGVYSKQDNPLVNAPHTAYDLLEETWEHPYSRRKAAYPQGEIKDKYWPPVSRVDNVQGDRNLVCSCPPVSNYSDE